MPIVLEQTASDWVQFYGAIVGLLNAHRRGVAYIHLQSHQIQQSDKIIAGLEAARVHDKHRILQLNEQLALANKAVNFTANTLRFAEAPIQTYASRMVQAALPQAVEVNLVEADSAISSEPSVSSTDSEGSKTDVSSIPSDLFD